MAEGTENLIEPEREKLIRRYAAGEITWRELRERGFDDYVQVLGVLGELGLRPPIARMEGRNVEARRRGRAMLREALRRAFAYDATQTETGRDNR
jgi:hypothetical protein